MRCCLSRTLVHCSDSPDFTKTSVDGYTFDTYWEGELIELLILWLPVQQYNLIQGLEMPKLV